MLRPSRRSLRAFTTVELIIAASIGAVFSLAVSQAVIGISGLAVTLTREANIERDSRNVLDIASRAIRNAVPLGVCEQSSSIVAPANCPLIVDKGDPFLFASADRVVFFAYSKRASATTSATRGADAGFEAPDLVELELTSPSPQTRRLCITVHTDTSANILTAWSGRTGTTPMPAGGSTRCVEPLAPTTQLLEFYDSAGTKIAAPATALKDITYIRIAPTLEFNAATADANGNRSRTRTYEQFVAVNSKLYAGGA